MVVVCPRCGMLGYISKSRNGNRCYVYVKHIIKKGGKTRYKYCYIGPEKEYLYVHTIHGDLFLTNIMDQDYSKTVLSAVQRQIEIVENLLEHGKRLEAAEMVKRLREVLELSIKHVDEISKKLTYSTSLITSL